MYGAILGDIIGSRFEFDRGGKTKEFELFTEENDFTDDTAMTVAVGEALMNAGKDADVDNIKAEVIKSMQDWGHRYPNAGYGGRFFRWLFYDENPKPYGSWGNGSAMRVSSAGWLYDSVERTREVARATAEVTHNHPEGIKGAECTVAVMFLARTGAGKDEIREYVDREFGYDLSESLDEMRDRHEHVESCQDSLPKALKSFMEGDSYEDVVRNAVSLGGDTDTLGAIAGAMAEAMYGVPEEIVSRGSDFLPKDMVEVLQQFDECLGRGTIIESFDENEQDGIYADNKYIKCAIYEIYQAVSEEDNRNAYATLIGVLAKRMADDGEAPAPMVDKNNVLGEMLENMDPTSIKAGDIISLDQEVRMTIDLVRDNAGNVWVPLYTDNGEIDKGETTNLRINMSIKNLLEEAYHYENACGLVINPFGKAVSLPKEIVKIVLDYYEDRNRE